jgi:succinyl-diaminopimelate desuccinylase
VRAVFSTDEEIGSADGVERLVKMGVLDGNRCVIALDGGDEDAIVRREKGIVHLTLRSHGKTAHNSTPWEGENAIEKMLRVYQNLKKALHEETTENDRWKTTVSIGTIQGGHFVNQVPGHCEAKIDIRFTDAHALDDVLKTIEKCLEQGTEILGAQGGHPFETAEDDSLLRAYKEAMEQAMGKPMKLLSEHGATDARFFRSMNVPIWLHYPKGGAIHTDDEWMDVASAEKMLKGLEEFVKKIA